MGANPWPVRANGMAVSSCCYGHARGTEGHAGHGRRPNATHLVDDLTRLDAGLRSRCRR